MLLSHSNQITDRERDALVGLRYIDAELAIQLVLQHHASLEQDVGDSNDPRLIVGPIAIVTIALRLAKASQLVGRHELASRQESQQRMHLSLPQVRGLGWTREAHLGEVLL